MAGSVPSVRRPIPMPSGLKQLAQSETLEDNETFFLVEAFMPAFREKQNKRFPIGSIQKQKDKGLTSHISCKMQ